MKVRRVVEEEYTWEQIREILAEGKAEETFGLEGELMVKVEGIGETALNILDFDKDKVDGMHTMTVQFRDLVLPKIEFDENGGNVWRKSSLRKKLNSKEFLRKFEEGFRNMVVQVEKKNEKDRETLDTFFVLSTEEHDEGKYRGLEFRRYKMKTNKEGEPESHWKRSEGYGSESRVWTEGAYGITTTKRTDMKMREAPACVLGAVKKEGK